MKHETPSNAGTTAAIQTAPAIRFHATIFDEQSSDHRIVSADTKLELIEKMRGMMVRPDRIISVCQGVLLQTRLTLDFG